MARPFRRVLTNRRRLTMLVIVMAIAFTLQLLGANPAVSQSPTLTAHRVDENPGLDPSADVWRTAPAAELSLTSFGGVPGLDGPPLLKTQAVHSDGMLYVHMSWKDDTPDNHQLSVDEFTDAAAVEFPAQAASSVPALCMGQADGGVNIWHWRASNEAGLPDSIEDLSSTGYVDRYPSTDDLYFPAREAGNPVALSHPVQDLVAVGFGTLTPATDQAVQGSASWENGRWSVVFARELSHEASEHVNLGEGASADIAFAVWDGEQDQRDGIKSVSQLLVLEVDDGIIETGIKIGPVVLLPLILIGALLVSLVLVKIAMDRSISRQSARSESSLSS